MTDYHCQWGTATVGKFSALKLWVKVKEAITLRL